MTDETSDSLEWLQAWYADQCDGDWEHSHGVVIATLDNPGWELVVNLEDTALANVSMDKVKRERARDDWVTCFIEKNYFKGYGGPQQLGEIISVFRAWAETNEK